MARTYKRDAQGRFAGGGGGGGGRPKARPVSRGANRLTRDNAGRITSQGGAGATARGGRLRTASGKQRAVQTARIAGGGGKLRKPAQGLGTAKASGQSNMTSKARPGRAANRMSPSPRRLDANQQIARDVMTNKKYRSDRQRVSEMIKRGVDPKTDFGALVAGVRAKQGLRMGERILPRR